MAAQGTREPICSVVIPTYNRATWLPACIESVRGSGLRDAEIIVVDDGSTDDTRQVVARFGPAVRYLHQPNAGCAAARNRGIRHSRGRFVAFLDSDDRWLPGGHQRLVEFLEGHPEIAVGFADVQMGNARDGYRGYVGRARQDSFWRLPHREEEGGFRVLERRPFFRRLASERHPVCIDSVVVRRAVLDEVGGFDETLRHAEEWELWLRLAAQHTFGYYDRCLAVYERHPGGKSSDDDRLKGASVEVLRKIVAWDLPLAAEDRAWLRARQAGRLFGWGYTAFDRGDHRAARERFAAHLRLPRPRAAALFYWGCTWLRPADVRRLRALKRRLSALTPRAKRALQSARVRPSA